MSQKQLTCISYRDEREDTVACRGLARRVGRLGARVSDGAAPGLSGPAAAPHSVAGAVNARAAALRARHLWRYANGGTGFSPGDSPRCGMLPRLGKPRDHGEAIDMRDRTRRMALPRRGRKLESYTARQGDRDPPVRPDVVGAAHTPHVAQGSPSLVYPRGSRIRRQGGTSLGRVLTLRCTPLCGVPTKPFASGAGTAPRLARCPMTRR